MRALILAIILGLAFPALVLAQTKAIAPATASKAATDPLKRLAKQYDKMKGVTWYRHASSPKHVNSSGFFLYFGKEDSGRIYPLHLVAQYYADEWLFVNRAWAKADGATINFPQSRNPVFGWERDHGDGKIWEWSDVILEAPMQIAAVRQLANAKNVTVRFEGKQYYKDRALSAQQLKAMREVIAAYEAATGKLWK